jgi:two-component system, NtrC family, sensor kinase
MTERKENLGLRLGAIVLALVTAAAVVFGVINFQQRLLFEMPDDGVTWLENAQGVSALYVAPNSSAERAGVKPGDQLLAINDVSVHRAVEVTKRLWSLGAWSQAHYQLARHNRNFEALLIVAPAPKPLAIENYLRIVGLLYLFIGLFIFVRRWNAARAVHFYIFCLVSFILCSFHYTGKLNLFDWEVYWARAAALLLAPALLLHFALVFPERSIARRVWHRLWTIAAYVPPLVLLLVHIDVATNWLGFVPSLPARVALDQIELGYLGLYFLLAAAIFLHSYRRTRSGILRQQLKWVTGGTLAGIGPFAVFYIVPYALGAIPRPWMNLSSLSLALVPLCFAYAIIRYRLMDVDIIFKRGLAYTAATAGVLAVYVATVGSIGALFHTAWPSGLAGEVLAIVVAAFLFQPFRDWTQARLDRFFYRDRLDYRRTLIEFGRTLTNEVRLEPMLVSVMDRLSQTLLVDRLAVFLENAPGSGEYRLARSMGLRSGDLLHPASGFGGGGGEGFGGPGFGNGASAGATNGTNGTRGGIGAGSLDLSFLSPGRSTFARGYLFYESPRASREASDSVRRTLDRLDLNYFIPCRIRDRTIAVLGLGKTVDGDFLTTEDVEMLFTIAGYVAIALDNAQMYTSLEQKAQQIERLKDFSENIVESLNVGVLAVDLEGRVEFWNTQLEGLTGILRADAVNRPLAEVLPADLEAEIAARADEDRVSSLYKFHLRNREGRNLLVNVSIAPLAGKSGERLGRLILVDDITQRMRLEEQLVQTEKLTSLGLLAAGVAHEVNTPLAVISNYIQILAKQLPADDPRHNLIEKIVKQTFRASEIVNNLLNFSRTGTAEVREVDLNAVIAETLALVAHPFRNAHVQVIEALKSDLPPVLGSGNRLQQVFLNLFLNAKDAMPSGGMLEVRSAATNGCVEVEVTDTGLGIAGENLQRIFDPFFTTKAMGRGTGLGLSVSYGIIKEHAGKIEVRSTPGKGTSFRLEFPTARKAVHA